MTELWAAIDIRRLEPRILLTDAGRQPLLKARMSGPPHHPKALMRLLEALSLWEGRAVRAALVVGERGESDMSRYHDIFVDPEHTPMYSIEYLASPRPRPRDPIKGMGRYQDLRQLLLFEVAR